MQSILTKTQVRAGLVFPAGDNLNVSETAGGKRMKCGGSFTYNEHRYREASPEGDARSGLTHDIMRKQG